MHGARRCATWAIAALALALHPGAAKAEADAARISFHYTDLAAFAEARRAIIDGAEAEAAYQTYIDRASPGFRGWMNRYTVNAGRFVERVVRYPGIYDRLPTLEADLRAREAVIAGALGRLAALAGNPRSLPVYYFVSSQHMLGGTPVAVEASGEQDFAVGVAVGLEPGLDEDALAAFPNPVMRAATAEALAQVAVHEAAHILQVDAQGSLENYRSIYSADGGSMLAIAVREGCAEYLTYLASGWRFGDRHLYLAQHERELWEAFKAIAGEPPFSVPGWFSGTNEANPDWPFQIGYSLGFRMCETYHRTADDPEARLPELFALYDPDDIRRVAAAYEASFIDR